MDTLLVIADIMTMFVVIRCLSSKKMNVIARHLWKVFSIMGVPKIMQSENGTEFVNPAMNELAKLNGTQHPTISAYNPRANGAVERTNATVPSVLNKDLEGAIHDWPDYIPFVQLSCKEKTSAITGATPFSLLFGRKLNAFEKYGPTRFASADALIVWKNRSEELHATVYPSVNERMQAKKAKMKTSFSKKQTILPVDAFPPGAIVMMLDKTRESN